MERHPPPDGGAPVNTVFEKMEFCAAHVSRQDEADFARTLGLLADADWRVRYAAAIALGDRRDPRAVDALVQALLLENEAPLFAQPKLEGSLDAGSNLPFAVLFPEGTTEPVKEAWRRRGRVIQAVCLALGSIGTASAEALKLLHEYATDQSRDYVVRAAACKALGQIAAPESLPVLEQAARDEETCTKWEAQKSLKSIKG